MITDQCESNGVRREETDERVEGNPRGGVGSERLPFPACDDRRKMPRSRFPLSRPLPRRVARSTVPIPIDRVFRLPRSTPGTLPLFGTEG